MNTEQKLSLLDREADLERINQLQLKLEEYSKLKYEALENFVDIILKERDIKDLIKALEE